LGIKKQPALEKAAVQVAFYRLNRLFYMEA